MAKNTTMMTLSFTPDTKERLKAYAKQNHTTVSAAITQWIWAQPVQDAPAGAAGADTGDDNNE